MKKISTIFLLLSISAHSQILKKSDTIFNLTGGFEISPPNNQASDFFSTKINISPTLEYLVDDHLSVFLGGGIAPQWHKYETTGKGSVYVINNNYLLGGIRGYFFKKENLAFYFSPNFSYHFLTEKFKNQTSYWGGDDGSAKTYAVNGSFGFICKIKPKLILSAETSVVGYSGIISTDNMTVNNQKFTISLFSGTQIGIKRILSSK